MSRKFLALVFLLPMVGWAQSPREIVDSLRLRLANETDRTKIPTILSDLTWYYSSISIDSALYYGNQAVQRSNSAKDKGQAYSDLASVYLAKGDLPMAKKWYFQSLSIRTKIKDKEGQASNWSNIGGVYQRMAVLNTAMVYYLKSLRYFESVKNDRNVDFLKNNIGVLYEDMRNFPKAIEMYNEVAAYRKKTGQNIQLAMVYNNLANVFKKTNDFTKSENYFNQSIDLSTKEGDSLLVANTYNNLAALYNFKKQPDKAIPVLNKARAILEKINSEADLALADFAFGIAYAQKKQYPEAKQAYHKALKTFLKTEANEYVASIYLNLIPVYANLNLPDSASFYTDKYRAFQEQTIGQEVAKMTSELETKYQTEKKEKQLAEQEAEAKRKNLLLALMSLFAVFVALVGYLIYRQQRLKNRQQEQEHALKLAISKIETQNQLQEQRLSISRDLHDNIGAQLTFIISSVDNIKYGFNVENPNLTSRLDRISNFTQSTIVELRDTIWAMNSESITFKDLELRIMNFIEKAKKAKEDINFKFEIADGLAQMPLTSIVGMNVYRTIQESVNNAVKYADAEKIAIHISKLTDGIQIKIADNGNGFDLENANAGNGLANMKKRIKEIGGTFHIESQIGKGTTAEIKFTP